MPRTKHSSTTEHPNKPYAPPPERRIGSKFAFISCGREKQSEPQIQANAHEQRKYMPVNISATELRKTIPLPPPPPTWVVQVSDKKPDAASSQFKHRFGVSSKGFIQVACRDAPLPTLSTPAAKGFVAVTIKPKSASSHSEEIESDTCGHASCSSNQPNSNKHQFFERENKSSGGDNMTLPVAEHQRPRHIN